MSLFTEIIEFVERGVGDSVDLSARKTDPNLSSQEKEQIDGYLRAVMVQTSKKISNIKGEIPLNDPELLTDLGKTVCLSTVGGYFGAGLVFSSTLSKLAVSASSCLFFGGGKALAISNQVSSKQKHEFTQKLYRVFEVYPELAAIMSAHTTRMNAQASSADSNPSSLRYRGN